MKLIEFKKHFFDVLSNNYDAGELNTIFYLFIDHFLNISKIDFLKNTEYKIDQENLSLLNKKLNELKSDRPIQYVIGKILVSDLTLIVNENVLIPRPETIELCEWIESFNFQDVRILDIGTGSGLIAMLLKKKLSKSVVDACDISLKSLEIAKKNASSFKVHCIPALNSVSSDCLLTTEGLIRWLTTVAECLQWWRTMVTRGTGEQCHTPRPELPPRLDLRSVVLSL